MILVTAATGKTGRHVVEALRRRGEPVRAMARHENVHDLRAEGVETVIADMLDPTSLRRAIEGTRAVVHIGPSFEVLESAMGIAVIDAALEADLERIVLFSTYHPEIEFLLNHETKLRTENHLVNSGLEYTILQPIAYMQNYDPCAAVAKGVLRIAHDLSKVLSYVDLVDVAEVAAIVLTEDGHANATYPLSGSDHLSAVELAAGIGAGAGIEVAAEEIGVSEFLERASGGRPLSVYATDALYRMCVYYGLHGLVGNSNVLRWLLGREPTTFSEYVERCLLAERRRQAT